MLKLSGYLISGRIVFVLLLFLGCRKILLSITSSFIAQSILFTQFNTNTNKLLEFHYNSTSNLHQRIIIQMYSPQYQFYFHLIKQKNFLFSYLQPHQANSDNMIMPIYFQTYTSEYNPNNKHILHTTQHQIKTEMNSSDQYAVKGHQLMKKASKTLKGSFFGNLGSNKGQRAEQAFELYKQAATNFKLAKLWDDATNAYLECIECDKISKGGQSADLYVEAANMKQKINTAECVKLLETAISINIQNNKISNIAKIQKRIAQIFQKDSEYNLSMKYYKEAAQNYSLQQNRSSDYNTCMLKVVDIGIYQANVDYAELIKILETIADRYVQNKLTAPSAKEQYFRAVLLFLANDDQIGASMALERYINNDPTFFQTRQQKFCTAMIKSLKEKNLTLFSDQCYKFNEIIPLDKWKTTVLTRIKALIPAPEENKQPQNAAGFGGQVASTKKTEKPSDQTSTKAAKHEDGEDSDQL